MSHFKNVDPATVDGFGREWQHYDQSDLAESEAEEIFSGYFSMFEFDHNAEGFDLGCGSGRWARLVAPRVKILHCIDPSAAIEVARKNLSNHRNVLFHLASADEIPLPDDSQDFGYSIGVLHHVPDPQRALNQAVRKLRGNGQLLVYIYYALENRGPLYRAIWRLSEGGRQIISRLPFPFRKALSEIIALGIYWPLARVARIVERVGGDPSQIPLSAYRSRSFYTIRTDALDRFGTRLERRFTQSEIEEMMRRAGLQHIRFSDGLPYWVAIGRKTGRPEED
jgi:SAM-dependent methyltransferase